MVAAPATVALLCAVGECQPALGFHYPLAEAAPHRPQGCGHVASAKGVSALGVVHQANTSTAAPCASCGGGDCWWCWC
jgi:hypothetical protein